MKAHLLPVSQNAKAPSNAALLCPIAGGARPDFSLHGQAAPDHGPDGVLPGGHQGERPQRLPAGRWGAARVWATRGTGRALHRRGPWGNAAELGGVTPRMMSPAFPAVKPKGQPLITSKSQQDRSRTRPGTLLTPTGGTEGCSGRWCISGAVIVTRCAVVLQQETDTRPVRTASHHLFLG